MTPADKMDPEKMLKGRMAESLVEELLKKSGNVVYRFGYEAIIQNLTQLKRTFVSHTEAGERIRAIPDFVVLDKEGNPVFIEVKFRREGTTRLHEGDIRQLHKIDDYWKAKVIFVNAFKKPYFEISESPYLEGSKLISKPLMEEKSWKITPAAYAQAEGLVYRYLSPKIFNERG